MSSLRRSWALAHLKPAAHTRPAHKTRRGLQPAASAYLDVGLRMSTIFASMPLTPERRSLLLRGPGANKRRLMRAFGGPAGLLVTWKRYRDELLAECPSERAFVARRLAEIIHQQRMSRTPHRAVA